MKNNKLYVAEMNERPIEKVNPLRFKKDKKERELILVYKAQNKYHRQKEFGNDYKKHLNITRNKISPALVFTF